MDAALVGLQGEGNHFVLEGPFALRLEVSAVQPQSLAAIARTAGSPRSRSPGRPGGRVHGSRRAQGSLPSEDIDPAPAEWPSVAAWGQQADSGRGLPVGVLTSKTRRRSRMIHGAYHAVPGRNRLRYHCMRSGSWNLGFSAVSFDHCVLGLSQVYGVSF